MDPRQSDLARQKYPYHPLLSDFNAVSNWGWTYHDIYSTPEPWLRKMLIAQRVVNKIENEMIDEKSGKGNSSSSSGSSESFEPGKGIPISQWGRVFSNKVKEEGIPEAEWQQILADSGLPPDVA